MRQILAFALIALIGLAGPAVAADLTVTERNALDRRLGDLTRASLENDPALIAAMLPPTLYRTLAEQSGGTAEDAKRDLISRIKGRQSKGLWQIVLFETSPDAADVHELPDGRKYMYVPIKLHDAKDTALHERTYAMFAVYEDGDWFFYPIPKLSNAAYLAELFPGLDTSSIPEPTRVKLSD